MAAKRQIKKVSRRMSRAKRRRKQLIFGIAFASVVIVFGTAYGVLYRYVHRYPENQIYHNIYIGGADVSGMSKEEARKLLEAHEEEDCSCSVTMTVEEKSAEATLQELGLTHKDTDKLVDKAFNYGKEGSLWSRYRKIRKLEKSKLEIDEKLALDEELAEAILNERVVPLAVHAQDAQIQKGAEGLVITKEKSGNTVDVKASVKKLENQLNKGWKHKDFTFKVEVIEEEPRVKAKDLETIQDELGTFSTDAGGGERWKNLSKGVELLNGSILMPGETLSVHDKTAPYDEEHGYVPAGSYENGQVVDSYGGGICQVSTTLYNAVLFAELKVEERYPHSMLVAYVDPSRDAAIAGDVMDFVFSNPYDTPVYIFAEIDGANQMRFTIYGKETRDPGRTVEYESETLATEDYEVVYKENAEAALGSMQYVGTPHTGKSARLWKVVYQDGQEVSREQVNESYYAKTDQVIEVGTKSDNPEATAAVRSAIASQDVSKINAAISQAAAI